MSKKMKWIIGIVVLVVIFAILLVVYPKKVHAVSGDNYSWYTIVLNPK